MRGWISAELDGELSDFESTLLRGHLGSCEACSAFKTSAEASTAVLRAHPLEPLTRQVVLPRRRSMAQQALRVPAVAAVAFVTIAFGGLFASLHAGALTGQSRPQASAQFDDQGIRALQLQKGQALLTSLRVRRAHTQASQIPRHSGFVHP